MSCSRTLLRTGLPFPRCQVLPGHHAITHLPRQISSKTALPNQQQRYYRPWRRPGLILGLVGLPLLATPLFLDSEDISNDHPPTLSILTTRDLVRSYLVYTICSFPTLVDIGPGIIEWCYSTKIPGVKWVMEQVVRATFFEQFAGSDTLEGSAPIVARLAARGVGTLFAYSVEADQASVDSLSGGEGGSEALSTTVSTLLNPDLVSSTLKSVEFASQTNIANGSDTAVAIKVSGLLQDPAVLVRLSDAILPRPLFTSHSHIALTKQGLLDKVEASLSASDKQALNELVDVFRKVGELARPGKVKVIIDAEQSWLQPAIDVIFLAVARDLRPPVGKRSPWSAVLFKGLHTPIPTPTFYMTLQASLRRSQPLLEAFIQDARSQKWPLGVKLVRGAYVDQEHKAAAAIQCSTPAWDTKQDTDVCYNTCATILVDGVATSVHQPKGPLSIAVMFASHNRHSVALIVDLLKTRGLVRQVAGAGSDKTDETLIMKEGISSRICFGQLYGMADDITDGLGRNLLTPDGSKSVYKYLPYGPLDRVIPYLVRRAKENKSIMSGGAGGGGAYQEKKRLRGEMKRRIRAWWNGEEDVIRATPQS